MKKDGVKIFYAKDRASWRKWLKKNHRREKKVWLTVYHKKSDTPSVYYPDAVEEALCFGWIDSKSVKRDEESAYLTFTRRNPKSSWSKINKKRVKKMLATGLMTKAGLETIQTAKENKTWTASDKSEKATMPADLKKRLATNARARNNFEKFPPSAKKYIFGWINEAKDLRRGQSVSEKPFRKPLKMSVQISNRHQNHKENYYYFSTTRMVKGIFFTGLSCS